MQPRFRVVAVACALFMAQATVAEARQHHHRHHHHHAAAFVNTQIAGTHIVAAQIAADEPIPRPPMSIPHNGRPHAWCGWYMRQVLGVRDSRFNLARAWASFGRPAGGPIVGSVVVWPHHVGRIVGPCQGSMCVVNSGNDGRRVRTRPRSIAGAIAFRSPD